MKSNRFIFSWSFVLRSSSCCHRTVHNFYVLMSNIYILSCCHWTLPFICEYRDIHTFFRGNTTWCKIKIFHNCSQFFIKYFFQQVVSPLHFFLNIQRYSVYYRTVLMLSFLYALASPIPKFMYSSMYIRIAEINEWKKEQTKEWWDEWKKTQWSSLFI